MSCPNNHPEDQITQTDGKRVCLACKRQYDQRNNTRIQKAISYNRNTRSAARRLNKRLPNPQRTQRSTSIKESNDVQDDTQG